MCVDLLLMGLPRVTFVTIGGRRDLPRMHSGKGMLYD
jgi:hypothetical protein